MAEGNGGLAPSSTMTHAPLLELWGIAGSPGVAVGEVVVMSQQSLRVPRRHVRSAQFPAELVRLDVAITRASDELRLVKERAEQGQSRAELSILDAYTLMLSDEVLYEEIKKQLTVERKCIEWAAESAIGKIARQLDGANDAYLRERSHDIEFIGDMLLRELVGQERTASTLQAESGSARIVIAHDLSPAVTAGFTRNNTLGIVTEVGTRTSHTAILARALDIPAVVGCHGILEKISHHERVIVDGNLGLVVLSPTQHSEELAHARERKHKAMVEGLQSRRDLPSQTRCGERFTLQANVELPFEAPLALKEGAEGIGLYRTEFLFVGRDTPPSEDEQYETYRDVVLAMKGRPVTFRTFDIGGDKFPAFVGRPEANPALGLRAVRLGLSRPEDFVAQLRAIVRASAHGPLKVMIPMIATVNELERAKSLLRRAERELQDEGYTSIKDVPMGCMIEVPAAALIARHLAERVDFFSIGTNDLVQYTLAVDRGQPAVAHLANATDPAILRLLQMIEQAAAGANIPVSVCGTMASDPLAAVLLLGLGFRDLSMESMAIASVKEALGRIELKQAQEVVAQALELSSVAEVDALLIERFEQTFRDILEID